MSEKEKTVAMRLAQLCDKLPHSEQRYVEGFLEGYDAGKVREEETCRNKENSPD